ncbi:MAG: DUF84 family protein [Clostridiales bacterium]|nr:DUF84 family protein [Clostridiales bacterium]
MKVVIATKNAGKIEGAKNALLRYFDNVEIQGIPAPSDVSEQPVNLETYQGAKNRVKNLKKYCKENNISADLYLAVESGITNSLGQWAIANIAVIEDNDNFQSFGVGPCFPVPEKYIKEIIETDLCQVMNKIFGEVENRKVYGGIQLLTHNQISRVYLNELAFTMALTKYINKEWN